MMNILKQPILMFLFSISLAIPVQASDYAKELRWANQITEFMVEGEPQWLVADGQKFFSIFTPATTGQPAGAVILLHGLGLHPDWPQVIQPLRTQLPVKGWATLSLQMPVLDSDARAEEYVSLFKDVPARIQAGLNFLGKRNVKNIVLIGHGLGSNMATDYQAKHHDPLIKAIVGIGMAGNPQPREFRKLDNVVALLQLQVPVLDVYGSESHPQVLASVDRRAYAIYLPGNSPSRQLKVNQANHFFRGQEAQLVHVIVNWMIEVFNPRNINGLVRTDNKLQSK